MARLNRHDVKAAKHIDLMLQYIKESKNSSEMLDITDKLLTILVDSDHDYLATAVYDTVIKFKHLKIGVRHDANNR